MLVPSVVVGEGSEQPPEHQPTPSTAPQKGTKRGRNIKVPQSGGSPNKVGNEAINEEMLDSVERVVTTASSLEVVSLAPRNHEGMNKLRLGVNTPGSDEGSLELNELMDLVTKLSYKVFDLEKVKTAQAKEITGLKRRITKLEQRQR
ncbi:hypothetical protein Tco_0154004 [Tanacetum coccineum]